MRRQCERGSWAVGVDFEMKEVNFLNPQSETILSKPGRVGDNPVGLWTPRPRFEAGPGYHSTAQTYLRERKSFPPWLQHSSITSWV
jgi:hypothetical protein